MTAPRVLVLRAPGTNCDEETQYAFARAGGQPERVHVNRLLDDRRLVNQFQILCVPGGFSYGDDLAAGKILAGKIRHRLADVLQQFHAQEKLILGICNGFQVLIRSGILLADDQQGPVATLDWNDSGRFEDRWVTLRCHGSRCVFLRGVEQLELPVAHAEGKFVARSAQLLHEWTQAGQIALTYAPRHRHCSEHPRHEADVTYPDNPNGSEGNVAGICDSSGRVFGLMPHPERHIDGVQHPQWTRPTPVDVGDGLAIFRNAVEYFA